MAEPAPTDTRGCLAYGTDELLGLLFAHGYLGVRHAQALVEEARSPERTSRLLRGLLRKGLVERVRHVSPYSPGNRPTRGGARQPAPSGVRATAGPPGGKWELVYSLSASGVRCVAEEKKLGTREAVRIHNRVRSAARMNHALLRAEFFAALAGEVRGRSGPPGGSGAGKERMTIEMLGAESTAGRLALPKGTKSSRRSLEPDGLIVLSDERYRDPLVAYVESDTGSQDKYGQIAAKADAYASYLSSVVATGAPYTDPEALPCVLFVSPGTKRSVTVRRCLKRAALDASSDFARARSRMQERNHVDLASLFVVTNLEWLASYGALGTSYWTLDSKTLRKLHQL